MSNFSDNPVGIGLSLGRSHGDYRHVLSGEELDRLEAAIRACRQTPEGSAP